MNYCTVSFHLYSVYKKYLQKYSHQYGKKIASTKLLKFIVQQFQTSPCTVSAKNICKHTPTNMAKKMTSTKLLKFIVQQFQTSPCTVSAKNICKNTPTNMAKNFQHKIAKIHSAAIPNFPLHSVCKKYLQKYSHQYGKKMASTKLLKFIVQQFQTSLCTVSAKNICKNTPTNI
jgi:tRNA G26 N,N-dimethylase Trm1